MGHIMIHIVQKRLVSLSTMRAKHIATVVFEVGGPLHRERIAKVVAIITRRGGCLLVTMRLCLETTVRCWSNDKYMCKRSL
jgi:hypothetical protein